MKDTFFKGGGAYYFGKNDFELGVGGKGQDTSRHIEGSFVSIRAILRPRSKDWGVNQCQNWMKMTKLCQSGIWPILCQLTAILAKLLGMDFKFVLPNIYINYDIQTNFEVNQTQIGHSFPENTPKITEMAIFQNPILPKCHSPKSLLLLHFSMNLSETVRINVNMDFAHTYHGRFLI